MAHAEESGALAPPHDARKRLAVLRNRAPGRLRRLAEAAPNPRSAVHTDGRPNAAANADTADIAPHSDGRPHADTADIAPHGDGRPHADTADIAPHGDGRPHADTADIAPHGDGRPHADTNVHGDTHAAATPPRES